MQNWPCYSLLNLPSTSRLATFTLVSVRPALQQPQTTRPAARQPSHHLPAAITAITAMLIISANQVLPCQVAPHGMSMANLHPLRVHARAGTEGWRLARG